MFTKRIALSALASTALALPAYASNAEVDMLMKEINKLKAQVNAIQKKSAEPAPSAAPVMKSVLACEAQGNGFFVVPGTTTCLRVSGYARADVRAYSNSDPGLALSQTSANNNSASYNSGANYTSLHTLNDTIRNADYGSRVRLNLDSRTSTDMGTLRGLARINLDLTQTSSGSGGLTGSARVGYAFFSLGGWSAGLQDTAFSFFASPGEVALITADDNAATIAASYTAALGSGVSATVSVENPYTRQSNPFYNSANNNSNASYSATKGVTDLPDVVGALQLVQGAATFKLSAATHESMSENSDSVRGYAVQGGMKYVVSPETTFFLQGTYADAAMAYLGYGRGYGFSNGIMGLGVTADFEESAGSSGPPASGRTIVETSSGWSALANLQQKLGPGVAWLTVSYGDIDDRSGRTQTTPVGPSKTYNPYYTLGNVEARVLQAELSYVYKPYEGLNIQPAVAYQKVDYTTDQAGDTLWIQDTSQYRGMLRVWREF